VKIAELAFYKNHSLTIPTNERWISNPKFTRYTNKLVILMIEHSVLSE